MTDSRKHPICCTSIFTLLACPFPFLYRITLGFLHLLGAPLEGSQVFASQEDPRGQGWPFEAFYFLLFVVKDNTVIAAAASTSYGVYFRRHKSHSMNKLDFLSTFTFLYPNGDHEVSLW